MSEFNSKLLKSVEQSEQAAYKELDVCRKQNKELIETLEHIKGFLERIDTETCGLDEHIELIESKIKKAKGELNG